jgi:ribose-phosphate pyrophosphokinase
MVLSLSYHSFTNGFHKCGPVLGPVTTRNYPSGEPLVDFDRGYHVDRLLLRPESMMEMMGALFFVDAMVERGHSVPRLILPFVPGARQDRLNDTGDYLFTAKSIAKEINLRKFPRVTVLDPHSEVISGMIDRCEVVHAADCFFGMNEVDLYDAVVSPDAGAEKRAGAIARRLKVPMLHGWKTRDVATGAINGFGMEPCGKFTRVLVVDDICDGGGTFLGLAKEVLVPRGIKADLYVTHGIFSQGLDALARVFFKIICTDSVTGRPREGVTEIPVCQRLLEGT